MNNSTRSLLLISATLITLALTYWMSTTTDAAFNLQAAPTATKPAVRTEILFPRPGTVGYGYMRIQGTALINDYQHYQVHIAPHGSENWQWLTTSYQIVREGDLHVMNTTDYPDGFYDLRVRAIQQTGNYNEEFVRRFEIRNENPPTPTPTPAIAPTEIPTDTVSVTRTPLLPPLSPIQTPSPLPTPTPTPESFIPGGQGIYAPTRGQTLSGAVRIVGTANAIDQYHRFHRYELYLSPTGMEDWTWLFSSQNQLFNDTLYVLDTTQLPNGFYDLRMRIVYRDANYHQYHVRALRVANDARLIEPAFPIVEVTAPRTGATLSGVLDVRGTIVHPRLQRWELYWAEHKEGEQQWLFLHRESHQVVNDLIARLDLSQVAPGLYDLRLRVVRVDGNYSDYTIRRLSVARPTSR
jgi:hypothetical protein